MASELSTVTVPNQWATSPDVIAQLAAFIDDMKGRKYPNNLWLTDERMEVYVRHSRRSLPYNDDRLTFKCLDVANVTVHNQGQGIFSQHFLPQAVTLNPWDAIYAENILTNRFADFFRKLGWTEIPGLTPCFFLVKQHN
jgi:hypothetical protein